MERNLGHDSHSQNLATSVGTYCTSTSTSEDKTLDIEAGLGPVVRQEPEPRSAPNSLHCSCEEDKKLNICSMVTTLKKEVNCKPFLGVNDEKLVNSEVGLASEEHISTYDANGDVKTSLENGIIRVKEEPISMFPHENVTEDCQSCSCNILKTEPHFDSSNDLCSDVKPNVECVVKQEVTYVAEMGETEGQQVEDWEEKSTELIMRGDIVTQVEEIQPQISNVKSLNDGTDVLHMIALAEDSHTKSNLAGEPGSFSNLSCSGGALSHQLSSLVNRPPVSHNNLSQRGRGQRGAEMLDKPHKCEVCGAGFAQNYMLQRHKRTHTGEKPYKCEICGKESARKRDLNIHKRAHTGEKPYKCEVCCHLFTTLSSLHRHRRTHTVREKPFKCEVCGAGFAQNNILQRHKIIHSGEKPYKCEICGKGSVRERDIIKHKRTHTGEKPYKCEICLNGFATLSSLHRHKITHTGEKPFECEVCGDRFARNSDLNRHKRTIHKRKPLQV